MSLNTFSNVLLTLLLTPYLLTAERPQPKKIRQHRGAAQARKAERNEAENRERRHITCVLKHLVIIEVVGMGAAMLKEVIFGG